MHVCRNQRKSLVDNVVCFAQPADISIPPHSGETAVLYERGSDFHPVEERTELFERDIANPEQANPTVAHLLFHCAPRLPIGLTKTNSARRGVQDIAVNAGHTEMAKSAL